MRRQGTSIENGLMKIERRDERCSSIRLPGRTLWKFYVDMKVVSQNKHSHMG